MSVSFRESECFRQEFDTAENATEGFRFHVSAVSESFNSSRALCLDISSDVASFHSNFELSSAINFIANETVGAWVGLTGSNTTDVSGSTSRFSWVDGSAFDFGDVGAQNPWASGEPSNTLGENCVGAFPEDQVFLWEDLECSTELQVLCRSSCALQLPEEKEELEVGAYILYGIIGFGAITMLLLILFAGRRVKVKKEKSSYESKIGKGMTLVPVEEMKQRSRISGLQLSVKSLFRSGKARPRSNDSDVAPLSGTRNSDDGHPRKASAGLFGLSSLTGSVRNLFRPRGHSRGKPPAYPPRRKKQSEIVTDLL